MGEEGVKRERRGRRGEGDERRGRGRREEGEERESCSERDLIMKPYNLYFIPAFACIHTAPSLHTPTLSHFTSQC